MGSPYKEAFYSFKYFPSTHFTVIWLCTESRKRFSDFSGCFQNQGEFNLESPDTQSRAFQDARLSTNAYWLTSQAASPGTLLHKRQSAFRLCKAKPCWLPLPVWIPQPGRVMWDVKWTHKAKTTGRASTPNPTRSYHHWGGLRGCIKRRPSPDHHCGAEKLTNSSLGSLADRTKQHICSLDSEIIRTLTPSMF